MDSVNFASIVSVAILSSFSHCIGMCGGFATLGALYLRDQIGYKRVLAVLGYHAMRILAYIAIGMVAGAFGGIFMVSAGQKAALFFVVGIALVIIGVCLWTRGRALKFIENEKISRLITTLASRLSRKKTLLNFMLLGFLNGLLPCGMVYYFAAQSIAASSAAKGALVMAVFGLSTLPALAFFGLFFSALGAKFRQVMFKISLVIVILNGIYLTFLGYMANG